MSEVEVEEEDGAVEWMRVGKFVRKENEWRLEGTDMSQTAVDYMKSESRENGVREESRVNPF